MTPAKSDPTNVVVVDGSNIATEGRSMPSLSQLNDAVMAFKEEHPEADITVERVGTVSAVVHRTALRAGRASNEASVQLGTFRWNSPPARSDRRR